MALKFSAKMHKLETESSDTYDIKIGSRPVILTSAHGIGQKKRRGWKLPEFFTRGISKYVGEKADCSYLVKNRDTGVDPNKENDDEFKTILLQLIEKNHIKLAIDLHGAKQDWDFDVEIGTLNGQTIGPEIIEKLTKCLNRNGIKKIAINDPFKGGDITRTVHEQAGIDCLQFEINRRFRSLHRITYIENLCKALAEFIDENY